MIIYAFRILCNEHENFCCDIEINATNTFYELHSFIQKTLHFDTTQLASFFITNAQWEKQFEITLMDMGDTNSTIYLMDKTPINKLLKQLKQRLLYVFDYFEDRVLFLELIQIKKPKPNTKYPHCIKLTGKIPQQFQNTTSKTTKKSKYPIEDIEDEIRSEFDNNIFFDNDANYSDEY